MYRGGATSLSFHAAPAPNIQPNFDALYNRQTGVPRLFEASPCPISAKVLPVYRIPSNGLEDSTGTTGIVLKRAFHKPAPSRVGSPFQQRELGAASHHARIVVIDPSHETAHSTPAASSVAPVKMMTIMTAGTVSLYTKALDPYLLAPAL